jgi:hypothetical protein
MAAHSIFNLQVMSLLQVEIDVRRNGEEQYWKRVRVIKSVVFLSTICGHLYHQMSH